MKSLLKWQRRKSSESPIFQIKTDIIFWINVFFKNEFINSIKINNMAKTDVANRLIWLKGEILNVNEALVNVL